MPTPPSLTSHPSVARAAQETTDVRPVLCLTMDIRELYAGLRELQQHQPRRLRVLGPPVEPPIGGAGELSGSTVATAEWDAARPPTPTLSESVGPRSDVGRASASGGWTRRDSPAAVLPPLPSRPPTDAAHQHRGSSHSTCHSFSGLSPRHAPKKLSVADGATEGSIAPDGGDVTPHFVTPIPRVLTEPSELVVKHHGDGNAYEVDNVNSDLVLFVGMMLCERYEIVKLLGSGTFGQVVMCRDHEAINSNSNLELSGRGALLWSSSLSIAGGSASVSQRGSLRLPKHRKRESPSVVASAPPAVSPPPELVAVKVIRSIPEYERQCVLEVEIVRDIAERFATDPRLDFIVKCFGRAFSFGHHCLIFELLGPSLFQVLTANQYRGMDASAVRDVGQQLLQATSLCHEAGFTHSDIKPENVLIARPQLLDDADEQACLSEGRSLRLIDFGAAFPSGNCPFTYVQSRYYRAPEVILDSPLTEAIDIWSVGCVLAELFLGLPLLPGADDFNQLELMQEMIGPFPPAVVARGRLGTDYFDVASSDATAVPLRTADAFYETYPFLVRPTPQPKYFNYRTIGELLDNYPLSQREREWAIETQKRLTGSASGTFSRPVIDGILSVRRSLASLLESLLQLDACARPTAADALRHPFFATDLPHLGGGT